VQHRGVEVVEQPDRPRLASVVEQDRAAGPVRVRGGAMNKLHGHRIAAVPALSARLGASELLAIVGEEGPCTSRIESGGGAP
jgi:hypothetical protein